MPEPATLYIPFPYAGPALLEAVAPEGVTVSAEGEAVWLRWAGGSIRVQPMAREQVPQHLREMVQYLKQHGAEPAATVRAMHSQGVLGMVVEPQLQDEAAWSLVRRLQGLTDGLLFVGGQFYTRDGAGLLDEGLPAPSAERVARRALVLLALAFRGLLDDDAGKPDEAEANELRERIWAWLGAHGLHDEAEVEEAEVLQAPIGKAERQSIVNAVWRAEGAQVLLWALKKRALPAHDAQEHPYDVAREAGLLAEGPVAVLTAPALRPMAELEAQRLQLQGLSWRMVEQRVNPGVVDLAAFAARAPFGAFSLEGVSLAEGDLALRGAPIHQAPAELRGLCGSIARERHQAANWLIGVNPVYSQVDTPT